MAEHTGWLLDVYDDRRAGAALWLLGDDGTRRCFSQFFPVTFYAAGNPARLRMLWRWIPAGLDIRYLRKGRTDVRAVCSFTPPNWQRDQDWPVTIQVLDTTDAVIAEAVLHMRVGPKPA